MDNMVKSVVFAAVVLFAGIAAMQVIYKNNDPKNNYFYEACLNNAVQTGDIEKIKICNLTYQYYQNLSVDK